MQIVQRNLAKPWLQRAIYRGLELKLVWDTMGKISFEKVEPAAALEFLKGEGR